MTLVHLSQCNNDIASIETISPITSQFTTTVSAPARSRPCTGTTSLLHRTLIEVRVKSLKSELAISCLAAATDLISKVNPHGTVHYTGRLALSSSVSSCRSSHVFVASIWLHGLGLTWWKWTEQRWRSSEMRVKSRDRFTHCFATAQMKS